ncbi:MAG: Mrp/NBP35 family ATP-binding protein [Acidaminococcaceae bacterium]|nr:Mrp/NBP35 family ATP-binding protein [Acidaminococcaceae bacterium]
MSAECNHDCSSCGEQCAERQPESFRQPLNELSRVRHVIGVLSGKGGVGKSMVACLLASLLRKKGHKVGILDADITGPTIPQALGLHEKALGKENCLLPVTSKSGIEVMSLNLLLPHETDPVVWRGPIIAGMVTQFWTEVVWGDLDFMVVDMPPGTGDVPLTVFQALPLSGIIVVTSPQELVGMIVEKAVKMAGLMQVPVLGVVENMSYFECPDCHSKHYLFGESHLDSLSQTIGITTVSKLPLDPKLAQAMDAGTIETYDCGALDNMVALLEKLPVKEN